MTIIGNQKSREPDLSKMILKKPAEVKLGGDATEDSYSRMPIENFGKNVLGKLGWKEDSKIPIGKNQKDENFQEPDFKNLMPRQSRLGLGAKPLTHAEVL